MFSADGARIAYIGRRDDTVVAVVDGHAGPAYASIEGLTLSARGGRVGYAAQQERTWHVVIDGIVGPAWDLVRGIAFSADGAHVAYVARRAQRDTVVVIDGVETASYTGVRPATLVFPSQATTPSYVAQRDFQFFHVHAGVAGPTFDDVEPPSYSADGAHWAYVGKLGDWWIPVIDGHEGRRERSIRDLTLAPAGSRAAYVVRRHPDVAVIVDGREHRFDAVLDGTLTFDATGEHWGCIAGVRAERRFYVVIDGRRTRTFDINEAIDIANHTMAAGLPSEHSEQALRAWVAAEIVLATR